MIKANISKGLQDRAVDHIGDMLQSRFTSNTRRGGEIVFPSAVAKISGAGSNGAGSYEASEQVWDNSAGAWIDLTGGRDFSDAGVGDVYELNSDAGVATDAIIQVRAIGGDEGLAVWVFTAPSGAGGHLMQITASTDYNTYTASRYGDGWNQAATETGLTLEIGQIATGEAIPNGTRLVAVKIGSTYYGQVPVWL